MKKLIRKRMVTEVPITSVLEINNDITLFRNPKNDKAAFMNLTLYVTALLLTLPAITAITALFMGWF